MPKPISKTTVVDCASGIPYDVYIGRPSKWVNPFYIGRDGSRKQVIDKYVRWIAQQPELLKAIDKELKSQVLGCHCKPLACHGDVLARLADGEEGS